MAESFGTRFQQETRHLRRVSGPGSDVVAQPPLYKRHPGVPVFALPTAAKVDMPLGQALAQRRSRRHFGAEALALADLAGLLWAAGGITCRKRGHAFRTTPSAGALYPLETYVIVNRVAGLETGLYHYLVEEHALEQLRAGALGAVAARAALEQDMLQQAGVVLVWSAVFARTQCKYGPRAYRYVYLDAGHAAENALLAATALNLGCCPVAAFYDDEINALIGLDGVDEAVLYMATVGAMAASHADA